MKLVDRQIVAAAKLYFALQDFLGNRFEGRLAISKFMINDLMNDIETTCRLACLDHDISVVEFVLKVFARPDVYPTEAEMLAAAGVDFARNYSPESAKKLVKRGLRITGSDDKAISAELIQWLAAESFRHPNGLRPGVHHKLAIDWLSKPGYDTDLHMVCMRLADEMAARGDPLYVKELDKQCLLNENGQNAVSAAEALRDGRKDPEDIPIYEDGKLPNRQIINRAKRGAVREYLKELYRKAGDK